MACIKHIFALFALATLLSFNSAYAVNPDEVLSDPALEQRARDLSKEIRCMVCQNQSIDDSDATVAKDLRLLIRERLTKGDSDEQVIEFLVARFGEFVLLKPKLSLSNMVLWTAPILFLIFGGVLGWAMIRNSKRKEEENPTSLSSDEQKELEKLLKAKK